MCWNSSPPPYIADNLYSTIDRGLSCSQARVGIVCTVHRRNRQREAEGTIDEIIQVNQHLKCSPFIFISTSNLNLLYSGISCWLLDLSRCGSANRNPSRGESLFAIGTHCLSVACSSAHGVIHRVRPRGAKSPR